MTPPPRPATGTRLATLYCAVAILLFATLSYTAASRKSPTYDEPLHIMAAVAAVQHGDFRIDPDHPPLWKYWAGLPLLADPPPVRADLNHPGYRHITADVANQWSWLVDTLYRTRGNDPDRALARTRFMMLLCAVALGAVTARFAWRLAGPLAACAAVTLYALDPNFLAHGSLTKNDIALTLCITALAYSLWRAGQALTVGTVAAILIACAAAVTTKLTGLLTAPVICLTLAARALLPSPWPAFSRTLATRPHRLFAAAAVCVLCFFTTYGLVWAVYGFRFNPSPVADAHFDTRAVLKDAAFFETFARARRAGLPFDRADVRSWTPGLVMRAAVAAIDRRAVPEAFAHGVLYSYTSRFRATYILGHVYPDAKWYYFPVAFLTKTPLATLLAVLAAGPVLWLARRRAGAATAPSAGPDARWSAVVLLVPVLVFGFTAVTGDLNIGVRHIFPLYPFLFIAVGIAVARLYRLRPKFTKVLGAVLCVGLLAESLPAFPNYIPFFNAAAGGSRGGLRILADSNLDWGQDLPLLAKWQREHPDRTLHLAYFGSADPAHYGIRYRNAPDGYFFSRELPATTLPTRGVLAVSASVLQGILTANPAHKPYAAFLHREPTEVLGGSIYLFDLDAP
jgi:hypothetical protein